MSEGHYVDISQVSGNYGKKGNARKTSTSQAQPTPDAGKSSNVSSIASSTPKTVKIIKPGPKSKKKTNEDPTFNPRVSLSPEDSGQVHHTRSRTPWNVPQRTRATENTPSSADSASKDPQNLPKGNDGSFTSSEKKILEQTTIAQTPESTKPDVSVRTDNSTLPLDTPKQKGKNFSMIKSTTTIAPSMESLQSSLRNAFRLIQAETHETPAKKVSSKSAESVLIIDERTDDDVVVIDQFKNLGNDNNFSSESSFDEIAGERRKAAAASDIKLTMDTTVPLERIDDNRPDLRNVAKLNSSSESAGPSSSRDRKNSYSLIEHIPDLSGYGEIEQRRIIDLANKLRAALLDTGVTQQAVGNITRRMVDVVIKEYGVDPIVERIDEQFEALYEKLEGLKKDMSAGFTESGMGVVILQNIENAMGLGPTQKGQNGQPSPPIVNKAEENGLKLNELHRILTEITPQIQRFGNFDMQLLKETLDGYFKKFEEREARQGNGQPPKPMEQENLGVQPQADGPPDPEQIRRFPRESLEARYTETELRGAVWATIPKGKVETLHHRVPTYIDEVNMNMMIDREQAFQMNRRGGGSSRGGRGGYGRGSGSKRRRDGSYRDRSPSPGPSSGRLASEIVIPEGSTYNQPRDEPSTSVIVHAERDSNFRSTFAQVIDLFEHQDATPNDLKAAQHAKKCLEQRLVEELNPMERWIHDVNRNNTLVKASSKEQLLAAEELEASGRDDQVWIDFTDHEQGTRSMITVREFKIKTRARLMASKYPYTINSKILKCVRRR